MFEELYTKLPDADAYLKRIGFEPDVELNELTLDGLILAHQETVPFENLDIYDLNRPISLSVEHLFDKIVRRRRGGYCFELNRLFLALLVDLGFDAYPTAARVPWGKDYLPPLSHQATIVRLGAKNLLCDVGFGGPMPGGCLIIEEGAQRTILPDTFRFTKEDEFWWSLWRKTDKGDERLLMFPLTRYEPVDSIALSEFYSKNPASFFVNNRVVNLRTPQGHRSIANAEYTEKTGGETQRRRIGSKEELCELLSSRFGLSL